MSAALWGADDPLAFPTYEQRVTFSFASEAEAEKAVCRIAPLPDGAVLSFGTRWDDTIANDVPKAEMLNTIGAKASFYLVGGSGSPRETARMASLAQRLRDLGHAVGNHTMTHACVPQFSPNGFFYEVMRMRMLLETSVDRTVNSYVSPYGWYVNPAEREQAAFFARMLVETGHYVSGDNPRDDFGLSRTLWYPSQRFSADDHHPSVDLFRKQSADFMARALADPSTPRLTLGTHAWCAAEGNEIQRQEIARLCAGRDWVHQSDWEYGSYRYEALNGSVRKAGTAGQTATFVVTRFSPEALAADVPLSLVVEPQPVEGLEAGARGTWRLPHEKGRVIVSTVDTATEDGIASKFPGLRFTVRVRPQDDACEVVFVNDGKTPLPAGRIVCYVAPVWKCHRQIIALPALASGEAFRKTIPLGARDRGDYAEDSILLVASADFSLDGRACRLWASHEAPGEGLAFPTPRDASLASGYLTAAFDDATLAAASVAGAALPSGTEWKNAIPKGRRFAWFLINGFTPTPKEVVASKVPATRYFVWDFTASESGKARFRSNVAGSWWANGRAGSFTDGIAEIDVQKGNNRILVSDTRVHTKYTPCLTLRKE